ncbi:hypothetical protein [Elizabethkingia anophelis]|uniref:hypothetical protein n=1 Tax=Elizabethkingia anophelis TaxID=1117645 RepID=UPI00346345E7
MTDPFFNRAKIFKTLTENEVIELLLGWNSENGSDLRAFLGGIYWSNPKAYWSYEGVYSAKTILREELGLEKGRKPGDIDIIIIPFNSQQIFFEHCSVYEVKVLKPTRIKPYRNANSLGVTQVKGLVDDGFPIISLIHVCMTEPLTEVEKAIIKCSPLIDREIEGWETKNFVDETIDVKVDHFSMWSSENQLKRLRVQGLENFIGINSFGLDFWGDGNVSICTHDVSYTNLSTAKKNPKMKRSTIQRLKLHFTKFRHKYKTIKIYHPSE